MKSFKRNSTFNKPPMAVDEVTPPTPNIKPKWLIALFAVALFLGLSSMASAATITNLTFPNGQVTVQGAGNSTVPATFRIELFASETGEFFESDVVGDTLPPVCESVGGELGLEGATGGKSYEVTRTLTFPPNAGQYSVQGKVSGIVGGFRADDCVGDVVVGPTSFSGVLRTLASGSGGSTTGSGNVAPEWFVLQMQSQKAQMDALIAALLALKPATTPAPAPTSSACVEYSQASAGLSVGSDTRGQGAGGRVGRLQSFLMYKGFDIPLLSSNQAPYGYFGNQTYGALTAFASANNCN